jgi:hypothetical protein
MPGWLVALGVAAQIIISVAAIWGERIRAILLRPRLRLMLSSPHGTLETDQSSLVPVRCYRLRVTNQAAHPEAREVEVLLTELAQRGPDGKPQPPVPDLPLPLPLRWRHQELYLTRVRTIGRATVAEADLITAFADRLQLMLLMPAPFNFPDMMKGEQHFWVTVIARGLNGESRPLRLKIDWDGQWDRGDAEMAQHLIITVEK